MPRVATPRARKPAPGPMRLPDRPGRWKLLLRRQRRRLRPLLLVGLAAGVLVAMAGAVQGIGRGMSFRERFGNASALLGMRVQQVVVEGRQKTPEGLLRAAVGVVPGDPILTYSVAEARKRIETIPWVQNATVERQLPDIIRVSLVERRPFAIWQNQGRFALIDRDGQLVTDTDVAAFKDQLPLVVGPGAPAAAAVLLDLLAGHPTLQSHVMAAVRVGERRWDLRLNNKADVMLPEGAEAQALAKLESLQADHALLDRPLQVVDMRLPDRLVLRPQPDPNAPPKDSGHGGTTPNGTPVQQVKHPT